jgi:diguanylate cyclase (GGDEF)-like protein/PAS domain S-box-containing protein
MNTHSSFPSDFFLFSSALLCVLNTEGTILQLNPAWEEQLNVVNTDLENSHFLAWVHPDDIASSQHYLAQLKHGTANVTFANRWRDCAGYYHWLNWEISGVPHQPKFYAVATDITAQKHAEKVLLDTEERFELAVKGSNHGLWDWNLITNEIYLSPRWKNILGYQDHEIANHLDEWCRFVYPEDFTQMWATLEAYLDKRIPHYESIYRMRHKDGHYHWVLARAAAIWDANDQPYRMVGTYVDITERKRVEQALQEDEALLAAIFEVTKIGLCITDELGRFARVNPAYCQLFGYTQEELIGNHFTTVLPPDHHDSAIKLHQAFLQEEPQIDSEGEWHIQNKAGRSLVISFTMGLLVQKTTGQRFRVTTITDITKRKHDAEERNRLFNLSVDMQSVIGFDVQFKEINAAWERTLGWTKAELMATSPMALVHPEDREASYEVIRKLAKGHTLFEFDNRYLCKNGIYKWLSWNVYPLVEQQTMYVVTRDITERKRAAEEIRRQQEFIRLVVDSVPNLIFVKDHFNNFIFVNQAVADLFDTTIAALVHSEKIELSHPLERPDELYSPAELQVIKHKKEISVEERCHDIRGELHCFQLVKKPFIQPDGDVLVLSVGTDITERKRHEEALRHSEARYRAIVQDQTDLVCRYLADGTLTFVNQAYCRYFGKTEAELVGHSFLAFLPETDQQSLQESLACITLTQPVATTERCTILPDGTECWQQWFDRALFDDHGQVIEYQGVGRDITARKLAEEALRQSEERLRFVTSAAPLILFALDAQGIFTFSRGKALHLLGYRDDEAVGQSVFDIFAALPKQLQYIRCALAGETVTSLANLPNAVLETKFTPLFDEEQQVTGVIGVSIDITERHQLEVKLQETVAELETILDNSVIGVAYVKKGIFARVNRKLESLLEFNKDELTGLPFSIIYPSYQDYLLMGQQAYPLLEQGKEYDSRHLIRTKTANLFWARLVGKTVDVSDLDKGSIWMIEDITVQKEAEQHLRLTAAIFDSTADGIFVTNLSNRIQRVNPAFTKITGYTAEEVYGKKTAFLASGRHDKHFYQDLWNSITKTGHWQGEIWNRKKDGEVYVAWLSISAITDERGQPLQYMAILTDISRLQEDIENARYLANYDSLTRLPNRLLFHDNLLQTQTWANRYNHLFALLFIDLDGFKPVNDQLGHAIGDQLLQGVAERLKNCVRESDTVARLGGDEFTIILKNIRKVQDAAKVASDLIQCLQRPFQLSGHQVVISASLGISIYPHDSKEIDVLLKCADSAMYEAKNAGKGRYCFYQRVV